MASEKKRDESTSASIDAAGIEQFIRRLSEWGDQLPLKDRAILQLLLSGIDRELTRKMAAGGLVQDVASAARNGLASLLAGPGAIKIGIAGWAKGGPMWAQWSSKSGGILINPADTRGK